MESGISSNFCGIRSANRDLICEYHVVIQHTGPEEIRDALQAEARRHLYARTIALTLLTDAWPGAVGALSMAYHSVLDGEAS